MKRNIFLCATLSLLVFSTVSAQVTTPAIDDKDTLKISTTLIQIDATVTDGKGNVVSDLKPEDFEVYENGKKQKITNFSFVTLATPQSNQANPASVNRDTNAVPVPSASVSEKKVRRTLALVVDDLGLNFGNILWVKQSLRRFVNEQMQEGDLVAIIRTGAGIGALQSFTTDKRQLLFSIEKIKWNSYGRSGIGTFSPIETSLKEDIAGTKRNDGSTVSPLGDAADKEFATQLQEFRNDNFAAGTLGALNYIINGMSELPGRKGLILFSEGFSMNPKPNSSTTTGPRPSRVPAIMKILADRANRASVVLYTIDPRGLQVPSMANSDDNIRDVMSSLSNSVTMSTDPRDARNRDFLDSQGTLIALAKETGGLAYINQNDIDVGIRQAVNDQTNYYLLGYQPDSDSFDPKQNRFNKLEVKVVRPGLKIRYRSGFFGLTDAKVLPAKPRDSGERLVSALISPFGAKDVSLNLYPVFQNDAKTGNMIQALVHIDANDLKFTKTADGKERVAVDIVATTFGDNGLPVDQYSKNFTLEVNDVLYQRMLTNGLVFSLPVPVKKAGAYQFRVALRDTASDRIGAASQFVEVPDIKKRLALSSVLLDNFSIAEWKKFTNGGSRDESERSLLLDAARRQYKAGSILSYYCVFYNPSQRGTFESSVRLIKDGKVLFEDPVREVSTKDQTDPMRLLLSGAVSLGKELESGSYLLQVIVTDRARTKRFATQHVEFEIVD